MSAPILQQDFHEDLNGLRYGRRRSTCPSSARVQVFWYFLPLFAAFILSAVWMFLVTLVVTLKNFDPGVPSSEPSAHPNWLLMAAFPAACLLGILLHARIKIGRALLVQRTFSCDYQDAAYIAGSSKLRKVARRLPNSDELQSLIVQTEDYVSDLEYLAATGEILKQLARFDNDHADELKSVIARQRYDITGSSAAR